LQELGKGSFGEVYLVQKLDTMKLYAMKILKKDKILGQNLVKYALTERNVLSYVKHPFIVGLNYAFQTSDKLFLILDYCPGGDLGWHLQREKRFSEYRARIYMAEVILALEELHRRNIIFRDLKPDNVLLDEEGHALLTDFGLSKENIHENNSAKSFCGSVAYLAPEILMRMGHGKAVDWYLLGVLMYEMLVGQPPYFSPNKEQLFHNIQRGKLKLPAFVSQEARSLLIEVRTKQLLQRDPTKRLGSSKRGAEDIKEHRFFYGVNWEAVARRELRPPIPPRPNLNLGSITSEKIYGSVSQSGGENHINGWSFVLRNVD
jgi:protein-serine/threonine kinase